MKCYLQLASMNNKNELAEGLEVISHTKMQYFGKEMTAEFYALKGMMYHLSSKYVFADKWGDLIFQIPRQIRRGEQGFFCGGADARHFHQGMGIVRRLFRAGFHERSEANQFGR